MVGLSAVLVHFRLNSVLVIGAALLAAIAVGRYRHAILGLALLAVSLASISLAYGSVDTTVMSRVSGRVLDDIVAQFPSGVVDLATDRAPKLLFESTSGVAGVIYAPFALALGLALVRGYLRREPGVVFVALSCVAAMVFLAALLAALPIGTQRLLVYIFPLLYLLVLMANRLRVIGYLFAALVVGSTLITFVTGFERSPSQAFWLHVRQQEISLSSDEPMVLSNRARFPYLFLGARAFRERLTWDKVVSRGACLSSVTANTLQNVWSGLSAWPEGPGTASNSAPLLPTTMISRGTQSWRYTSWGQPRQGARRPTAESVCFVDRWDRTWTARAASARCEVSPRSLDKLDEAGGRGRQYQGIDRKSESGRAPERYHQ